MVEVAEGVGMGIDNFHHSSRASRAASGCTAITGSRPSATCWLALTAAAISLMSAGIAAAADLTPSEPAAASFKDTVAYDWTGFYVGGHLGYAWGNSNWAATGADGPASGSLNFSQGVDLFSEAGSWNEGVQFGYNAMLQNRVLLGVEADFTFPAYPNPINNLSTGGSANYAGNTYTDTLLASGTVRGRIGYAPGNWLFYATGGLAWTSDQITLSSVPISSTIQRLGWAAGAGAEFPISGHWTGKVEYLFTDYGYSTVNFSSVGDRINSNLSLQEARVGLNYQFGNSVLEADPAAPAVPAWDGISFHGQTTFVEQGYPAFHSAIPNGLYSLPSGGEARETYDLTLYAGMKLWQGAELWADPEIDQGFGVGNAHGLAGFSSAESYKLGSSEPYARVQRFFVRQTIDLGGDTQKVDADINQFEGSTTSDRLVLTAGLFQVVDLFDTNKYANNAKTDFLNWTSVNTGSFDYAGDAWAFTYGAAAEWYTGRWTLRTGIFDMSRTPAAAGYYGTLGWESDPDFKNFQVLGEIEERHELWGQPGKLKITPYFVQGDMGDYKEAIALFNKYGPVTPSPDTAADYYMNATRKNVTAPGVNFNMEQQVTDIIGVFARAGWCDGNHELWDNTDVDRSGQFGAAIKGTQWGRPDDTVGISGTVNGISGVHAAWINQGGLGILIGDTNSLVNYGPGSLPHPGLEKIIEAYYSYALTSSTKLTFDYQFIDNPAYNTDRGPVNLFAGRFRWAF
ncbi:MAG: carbohydrate porin [Rhodomicrobium sp.]